MRNDKHGPRVNDDIRVREVRVIVEETGEQLGILPTFKALQIAQERGLDLVEVSDSAKPPVCKILDYGAYKFKKAKALKEAKKAASRIETKEMRFKPRIADHDLEIKSKKVREFLQEGNKVMLSMRFKGREQAHLELGKELLQRVIAFVEDIAQPDKAPLVEGGSIVITLSPK